MTGICMDRTESANAPLSWQASDKRQKQKTGDQREPVSSGAPLPSTLKEHPLLCHPDSAGVKPHILLSTVSWEKP